MVRTYACERCHENYCTNCGSFLFAEKDSCAMCGMLITQFEDL